jgi:hypothetical protein
VANKGGTGPKQESDWRDRLKAHRCLVDYLFADEATYQTSLWADWERRIRDGHDFENKQIGTERDSRRGDSDAGDFLDEHDDWAGGRYLQSCRLTNHMYGALVVAMWLRIEYALTGYVSSCRARLALPGKKLYRWEDINEFFQKKMSILLASCKEYETVKAIRILNNEFKHNQGWHFPDDQRDYKCIDKALLAKWSLLHNGPVDYSRVPVKEWVLASHAFCHDLLNRIKHTRQG